MADHASPLAAGAAGPPKSNGEPAATGVAIGTIGAAVTATGRAAGASTGAALAAAWRARSRCVGFACETSPQWRQRTVLPAASSGRRNVRLQPGHLPVIGAVAILRSPGCRVY